MNSHFGAVVLASALALAAGCGGGAAATPVAAATLDEQVRAGAELYAGNCAGCHGDKGEGGGSAPPLIGAGALPLDPPEGASVRKGQFKTAADVLGFVTAHMPPPSGGLREDQYLAILAFDLRSNGKDLGKEKLSAAGAAPIVLHP